MRKIVHESSGASNRKVPTPEYLWPTILFKGTTRREYVVVKENDRNIFFTKKMSEATIFTRRDADIKIINFPSHPLKTIFLNDDQKISL